MERYEKVEKNSHCGQGTYGVVYKARDNQTDMIVAMKVCLLAFVRFECLIFYLLSLNLCFFRELDWK
jgi:serine/threonine protein kinase